MPIQSTHLNIALFGLGTVGTAFCRVLSTCANAHASIRHIVVRNIHRPRPADIATSLITDDADKVFDDNDINLVVEVIDDADAAFGIVSRALRRGLSVVSGNKAMIAAHLPELISLQRSGGGALLYDASSCGSIPVIRNLEEYYDNDLLLEVRGILNGSSNYILSRVFDHGEGYGEALALAQRLGFAESDPSLDLSGIDSLNKLVIITMHALGVYVSPAGVFAYGIQSINDNDISYAREKRAKIKLVAQVAKVAPDRFTMFVMPEFVTPDRYIYGVDNEYNGVVIRGECYDRQFMFGKGAGGSPTASSILSDVMARCHDYRYEYKKMGFANRPTFTDDVVLHVYARYNATDVVASLPWRHIDESYRSAGYKYVIGDVALSDLYARRKDLAEASDVFLCNFNRFFTDRDD